MNATPLLFSTLSAPPIDGSIPPAGPVSLQTALLVIVAGGLILVARSLGKLRARIEDLEHVRKNPTNDTTTFAPAASASLPAVAAPLRSDLSETVPDEIAAIIAAAVHATFGNRARVAAVAAAQGEDRAWSLEGRRQIFQSHKIR